MRVLARSKIMQKVSGILPGHYATACPLLCGAFLSCQHLTVRFVAVDAAIFEALADFSLVEGGVGMPRD